MQDAIYDLEILENFSSCVVYQPQKRVLYVGFNTYFEVPHGKSHPLPRLTITDQDRSRIYQAIKENVNTYFSIYAIDKIYVLPEKSGLYNLTTSLLETWPKEGGTIYGFNSTFYDNTLLVYFESCFNRKEQPNTYTARLLSNSLIEDGKKPAQVLYGVDGGVSRYYQLKNDPQHLDIQNLNEKMSRVSLKRLIAQLGGRIQTSQKLKGDAAVLETVEDVIELLTYNVSDVLGSYQVLMDTTYQDPLATGTRMIEKYGDNRFEKFKQATNRTLKRDTTSANFIEAVISPTIPLEDDLEVSLAYPIKHGYIPPLILKEGKITRLPDWEAFNKAWLPQFNHQSDQVVNDYLASQKEVPFVKVAFFYNDGSPKVQQEGGIFKPLHTTFEAFQKQALDLLELDGEEKAFPHRINQTIKKLAPQNQDYGIFYNLETNHPRVVFKEDVFQIDLLEWLTSEYPLDEPYKDQLYRFYDSYRGQDVRHGVPGHQDDDVKGGVKLLLPFGCPVYATASIGGIHGNLIDRDRYENDLQKAQTFNQSLEAVESFYTDIVHSWSDEEYQVFLTQQKERILKGSKSTQSRNLKTLTENVPATLARLQKEKRTVEGGPEKPWEWTSGSYAAAKFKRPQTVKDLKHYSLTLDADEVVHADITSYYPTLITTLKIFKTGETDPYKELLESRIRLKAQLPNPGEPWLEKHTQINNQQLLDKLLLNAASGKADSNFDNHIRVNNKIYRMRIAGQLIMLSLCLRIAQVGGVPNSINTDGVFVHNITLEQMEELLEEWCDNYRVGADGEIVDHFISKSAGDRVEIYNHKVGAVGGGEVSYYKGPHLKGTLRRPAITDYCLVEYFLKEASPLSHFNVETIKDYMKALIKERPRDALKFFQYITVSNPAKSNYILLQDENGRWHYPSPINRLLYVTSNIFELEPKPWVTSIRQLAINKQSKTDHPKAFQIAEEENLLKGSGYFDEPGIHATFKKIANLEGPEDDQLFVVINEALDDVPLELLDYLDLDKYVDYVKSSWDNWAKQHLEERSEGHGDLETH